MKKLLFSIFITLILFSCNQGSQKGAWNHADKESCRSEGKEGLGTDMELALTLADTSVDDLIDCMCNTMEENYENYAAANEDGMNNSTGGENSIKLFKLMFDCLDIPAL